MTMSHAGGQSNGQKRFTQRRLIQWPNGNIGWVDEPIDDQGAAQERSVAVRPDEAEPRPSCSPVAAHPLGTRALEAAMAFRPDPAWSARDE